MLTFLPVVAVVIFMSMMAVAEYQIRSSPKWPPPARHEIGGWQIDDPPLWTWAASLNLPATIPIMLIGTFSVRFTYALDDHHLIVYLPWSICVLLLWCFVARHLDLFANRHARNSGTKRYLMLSAQLFITLELIYAAAGEMSGQTGKAPTVVVLSFFVWLVAAFAGWVNLIYRPKAM
jgi:hypothetical protein